MTDRAPDPNDVLRREGAAGLRQVLDNAETVPVPPASAGNGSGNGSEGGGNVLPLVRWKNIRNRQGEPAASLANAVIGIRCLRIGCRFDKFHNVILIDYDGQNQLLRGIVGELNDNTLSIIRSTINNRLNLDVGDKNTLAAVVEIANENSFDLVLEYLADCQARWDGVERIGNWQTTYCGAPHSSAAGDQPSVGRALVEYRKAWRGTNPPGGSYSCPATM